MAKKKEVKKEKTVSNIDLVRETLNKKFQKHYGQVLTTMADCDNFEIPTISTGSLGLDVALGRGGLALGRIYELYGRQSSGKTTLAISTIVEAQKKDIPCVFVDVEHAADPVLFQSMGVDTSKLHMIQNLIEGEDYLEALGHMIRGGAIKVAVIDSVSALLPKAENEADFDKDFYALQARLMSKSLRKLGQYVANMGVLLIFINQIREKVGGYGNPETTSGGNALGFYATGRIKVAGGAAKASRIEDDAGEVVGHTTKFIVEKNKLGAPYRTAEVNLIYGYGYDKYGEVLDLAASVGIVGRKGAYFYYGGEQIAQGSKNARDVLMTNDELYNKIRGELVTSVGLDEFYE